MGGALSHAVEEATHLVLWAQPTKQHRHETANNIFRDVLSFALRVSHFGSSVPVSACLPSKSTQMVRQ